MIHPVWQFLFFLEAQRPRHTTDFKRNGPTWLHISVHPVAHQSFETETFCPVSVPPHGTEIPAQPRELPLPLRASRCTTLNCGVRAVVPSFSLRQLHPNPDSPQNGTTSLPLARETERTKTFDLGVPTSRRSSAFCCLQSIPFGISSLDLPL